MIGYFSRSLSFSFSISTDFFLCRSLESLRWHTRRERVVSTDILSVRVFVHHLSSSPPDLSTPPSSAVLVSMRHTSMCLKKSQASCCLSDNRYQLSPRRRRRRGRRRWCSSLRLVVFTFTHTHILLFSMGNTSMQKEELFLRFSSACCWDDKKTSQWLQRARFDGVGLLRDI